MGRRSAKVDLSPRSLTVEEFAAPTRVARGHEVRVIRLFDSDKLCTEIYVDFTEKTLAAHNYVTDPIKTAFGNNVLPSWTDFIAFLEERCIPRQRAGLQEYLDVIGVSEYDPFSIIQKTAGRMAEDNQWVEIVDSACPR